METDALKNSKEQNSLASALSVKAAMTGRVLDELLDEQTEIPPHLKNAMAYMLQSGGKRIRSALVMWCCELVCGQVKNCMKNY